MLNQVNVIGHLGTDPELRYTPAGNPVCDFRMAVSNRWTDSSGEQQERTEWFTVVCWNRTAENVATHLRKGQRAFVSGRLQTQEWTDREGNNRVTIEIVAVQVVFLSPPETEDEDSGESEMSQSAARSAANSARKPANTRK